MAKIARHYTLPKSLLELYEGLPISRSAGMAMAIKEACDDPRRLTRALTKRIETLSHSSNTGDSAQTSDETAKVTVSLDEKIIEGIAHIAKLTNLPVEHAMRLAMEAYIHKL